MGYKLRGLLMLLGGGVLVANGILQIIALLLFIINVFTFSAAIGSYGAWAYRATHRLMPYLPLRRGPLYILKVFQLCILMIL